MVSQCFSTYLFTVPTKQPIVDSQQHQPINIHNNSKGKHQYQYVINFTPEHEESKTNSMLHNGLLDLMNRSTGFGHSNARNINQ